MSIDGLVLTVLAVLAGIFVGLARGGRFRNIVGVPVRAKGLLLIGIVVPALADEFTREVAVPLVVGGLAALLAFAIVNVRIVGMSVMAVGILANLLATFLNGGLPVNREALVDAGLATPAEVDRVELRGARRLEEPTHRVRFLGDIIPLEETGQVLAFGDLVILVGLADIMANLTLHKRKRSDASAGGATTEAAGEPPSDDAVAVIDLVRLHVPRGARNPRPRAPGPPLTEPEPELAPAAVGSETMTSPDVDWWPRAEIAAPVDSPADAGPLVPELVEEPVDELLEEPELIDLEPQWAPEPAAAAELRDTPWSTEPRWAAEPDVEIQIHFETDDVAELEIQIETDTDDVIELTVDAGEPTGAPSVREESSVIDLREQPAGPAPRSTASTTADSIDDELFHLLFADLSKSRRHRRRGERTIPDFEPVHVDDITLRRR